MPRPKRKKDSSVRAWAEKKTKSPAFRAGMQEARLALLIARARKQKGLSQTQLARRVGTTQSIIARLESGEHNPTVGTYARVVDALGKKVELV